MKSGLLWYDDSERDLAAKVRRAAARYEKKHGIRPNVCYVHSATDIEIEKVDGVRVAASATVLCHHLWLGRNDADGTIKDEMS